MSCSRLHGVDLEAQRGSSALVGGDGALALLLFVAPLALLDEGLAAGEHEVHHPRQLVGSGGVGAGLVHAGASRR